MTVETSPGYPAAAELKPVIIPRAQHPISRKKISRNALKIMYRLKDHGYLAYLVGGAVRDLLLGRQPADFDLATDAKPQQIKKLFRNSRIIGRRFRLVHIFFTDRETGKQEIIEVATFRKEFVLNEENRQLLAEKPTIINNIYGSPAEDVLRRDFTINALFYSIDGFKVIDYLGGINDLREGIVRIIGNPYRRFAEDPVRVLRAVEFACRLDFRIEEQTLAAMRYAAPELATVPPSRMREELRGLYTKSATAKVVAAARETGILEHWLPANICRQEEKVTTLLQEVENHFPPDLNDQLLEALVITAMLLPAVSELCPPGAGKRLGQVHETTERELEPLVASLQLPRFQRHRVKDIIIGTYRLVNGDKRVKKLRKRSNFYLSFFFFARLEQLFPRELHKIAGFWRQQSRRWPPPADLPRLQPANFFPPPQNRDQ